MIRYRCNCGATFSFGDDLAGRKIRCTQCGKAGRAPDTPEPEGRLRVPSDKELAEIDLNEFLDPSA